MIKALIIDDEEPARAIIKSFLQVMDDITVVGECTNGFDGIKKVHELNPDLVFLDIHMPKLNGFEMLELIDEPPVIIFSTAYDQYAVKAFENNAVDYLLKPYSEGRFREAVEKALDRLRNNIKQEKAVSKNLIEEGSGALERIAIRNGTNITIIPVSKISHIEAQDDYVAIYSEGKKYLKQYTMGYLAKALPPDSFIRVHRSYIVNLTMILRLEAMTKDSLIAILQNGVKVPVSKSGYSELKNMLKI